MKSKKHNEKSSTIIPECIKSRIEKIRIDNTSGAQKLTKQVAESLIFLVDNYTDTSKSKVIKVIEQTILELKRAQPTMASIFNLTNSIMFDISTSDILSGINAGASYLAGLDVEENPFNVVCLNWC